MTPDKKIDPKPPDPDLDLDAIQEVDFRNSPDAYMNPDIDDPRHGHGLDSKTLIQKYQI